MGQKSKKQIIKDLTNAGVSKEMAKKLAEGASLKGKKAKEFLKVFSFITTLRVLCQKKVPALKVHRSKGLDRSE